MTVITKTFEIKTTLPVTNEFIEEEILKRKFKPIRWAIVNVSEDKLKISVAGEALC
ncbi:hypothetical protein KBA27_03915 [bacterium]|nr:hypothetical protein [bacterium]